MVSVVFGFQGMQGNTGAQRRILDKADTRWQAEALVGAHGVTVVDQLDRECPAVVVQDLAPAGPPPVHHNNVPCLRRISVFKRQKFELGAVSVNFPTNKTQGSVFRF